MTYPSKKKGSDLVSKMLEDPKGLLDGIDKDAAKISSDISQKRLSDNELILRMSIVKSVCSLRAGTQISTKEVITESNEMLSWVKSLQ
jgi:hypothetical protein